MHPGEVLMDWMGKKPPKRVRFVSFLNQKTNTGVGVLVCVVLVIHFVVISPFEEASFPCISDTYSPMHF